MYTVRKIVSRALFALVAAFCRARTAVVRLCRCIRPAAVPIQFYLIDSVPFPVVRLCRKFAACGRTRSIFVVDTLTIAMGRIVFDLTGLSLLMVGSEGYDAYLTDENRIGTSSLKFNIVYNFIVLIYFFFGKDKKEYNIYVYCFLIGAIIQNVSVQFANFYRMSLYFTVFSPIVISEMVYDFLHDKSSKKVLNHGLTAMIILLYIRSLFISIAANSEYIGKEMNSLFDIF